MPTTVFLHLTENVKRNLNTHFPVNLRKLKPISGVK